MSADVSVIIPAFNGGEYLRQAVKSVITQTHSRWELLVVDDGGRDDLAWVPKSDPRVRLLRQVNMGTSAARNAGVLAARSPLIAFLDHDDLWYPTKLQEQLDALARNPSVALCYTQFDLIDSSGRRTSSGYSIPLTDYHELLEGIGGPCLSTAVMARDHLISAGLFDPLLPGTQDYDLFLRVARLGKLHFINTPLAAYRLHANNTSRNYRMVFSEVLSIAQRHQVAARQRNDGRAMRAIASMVGEAKPNYAVQAVNCARACWRARAYRDSVSHLLWAWRTCPSVTASSLVKAIVTRLKRKR